MSVPVRYSAAANYAVVDSGLSNTLQQEEQYHQYQQQLQQQQQHQQQQLYCQFAVNQNNVYTNVNSTTNNYYYNNNNNLSFGEYNNYGFGVQQQLIQQRSSMSSSVSPATGLPAINNNNNNHNNIANNQQQSSLRNMDNININNVNILQEDDDEVYRSSQYQQQQQQQCHFDNNPLGNVSACEQSEMSPSSNDNFVNVNDNDHQDNDNDGIMLAGNSASSLVSNSMISSSTVMVGLNGGSEDVDVDEWNMSDEGGRYGTPGAAGLDYQKYELEQQQLQQTHANLMNQKPLESSLMDNENRNMNMNLNQSNNTTNNNTDASCSANVKADDMNVNNIKTKEDELSALPSDELYRMLNEYNVLQDKYHTVLLLPRESKREVTAGGRDGSAYVLRCLKMWYELPSDVLFSAMSLVDRFLDRMAVKPKHMACMSVASFHLAIKQLGLKPIPAEELVTISQCGCTAGDLERMAGVIANKLGVQMGTKPVTAVTILRVFYALFRNLAKEVCEEFYEFFLRMITLEDLENRLENLLCDVKTTVVTPSTLALILICLHLDFHIKASYKRERPELKPVFEYILFLQQYLRIPDRVFSAGFTIVADILSHYNGQNKQPYKQRLVWKLSSRTMKVLRPTNRFSTDLPTIDEGQVNVMDEGCRSRTESISSEEEEDWPTSPIIPIFEQC